MSGKREKTAFRDLRNAKNAEKCVSNPSESQKMQKNARRRPTKRRKREKTLIVGRRNAKNAKKCLSSVDEMQKMQKNARRRSTKRKKREKVPVVGRRNAENAEKQSFVPLRRTKNGENSLS